MAKKDKQYYWLKLKKDFFKRHDMQIIEAMPNGKDYVLFYLKLLLESVDHEGELRFNDTIPYNLQMLSTITNTNIDIVRSAIELFKSLNMIDIWNDGTYYVTQVEKMLGHETYWAEQKRLQRQKEDNVQQLSNDSQTSPSKSIEKEKELEKDIELELDIDKDIRVAEIDYEGIKTYFNNTCTSLPNIKTLSDTRKKNIKKRIEQHGLTALKEVIDNTEASDFLSGRAKEWKASFDWIIKKENFIKIHEGNYTNKNKSLKTANVNSDTSFLD